MPVSGRVKRLSVSEAASLYMRAVSSALLEVSINKSGFRSSYHPTERPSRVHCIAATDAEIDHLVYELYGITAGERKIVEEAVPA
jgi:hypothetical protein